MTVKILCGVDGQDHSARAITAAAELAKRLGAELTLCMVNPACLPGRGPIIHLWPDEYVETILNDAIRRVRWAGIQDIRCMSQRAMDIADAIVACADEQGAAYIVVGASERSELSRLFGGSVSRGVTAKANCPVLVVRRTREQQRNHPDRGLLARAVIPSQGRLQNAEA